MPVAPPIFHVGYHKTATTWFQTQVYPSVSNATMVATDRVRDLLIVPRAFEFDPEPVRREFARCTGRAIVCHEELSGNIHSGGLQGCLTKEIAHRLHTVDPDGRVVIFLRNQVDMIASAYRQYVRVGGSYSVDRYLRPESNRPNRAPVFDLGHFDYRLLIDHYVGLFGRRQVSIYLYEELRDDSGAFLSGYLADLELDADADGIDHRPALRSYGDATIRVARVLNVFTREELPNKYYLVHMPRLHQAGRRVLDRFDRRAGGGRAAEALLGLDRVAAIVDRFGESNRRLADDFGLPLAAHGYPLAG